MTRHFTIDEANEQVPLLRELFGLVMQLRGQLRSVYERLAAAGHPPSEEATLEAGDDPTGDAPTRPEEVQRDIGLFRALAETLQEQIEKIQETGCLIKDLDVGLVDWVAVHRGREVLLCWKYGEPAIGWWHELHAGFAGRRPIAELIEPR